MKAIDLMIGDWVCYDGDENHEYPVQIDGISKEDAGVDGDWYDVWEPIPLTEEILEKNGFKEVDMNDFRLFRDKEYDCKGIRISFTNKGVCLRKGDSIGISCKSSGCCHYGIPAYVHELQHALKLCGIEKEIVL